MGISIWINDVYFGQIEAINQQQIELASQTVLNSPSFQTNKHLIYVGLNGEQGRSEGAERGIYTPRY